MVSDEAVTERPAGASPATKPGSPLSLLRVTIVGLAMGAADVVPGFSGGTVALVGGIYERLIANVRQGAHVLSLLLRGRLDTAGRALRALEWPFVIALLTGILVAVFSLASVLSRLIEEQPVAMSAVFLGLVIAATAIATRELHGFSSATGLLILLTAVVTFVGLGVSPGTIDEPATWMYFAGGAVAICAMILPGISGSFLLLVLGLYVPVIDAVEARSFAVLLVFAGGCVVGLGAFSTLLNWLLARAHDLVLAVLLGLMLGSVRILWPWPMEAGFADAQLGAPSGNEWLLALSLASGSFAVVWMIGLLLPDRRKAASPRAGRGRLRDEGRSDREPTRLDRGSPPPDGGSAPLDARDQRQP